MNKRLLSIFIFLAYTIILIKVMVFKDIPTIKVGQLMLNFGGTDVGHAPNFVPFKTILPYLLGYKGWIIAGINLAGNIALLVPIGVLLPFVYQNLTWKRSVTLAFSSGLVIEAMQTILHVGIFDIDDVILNALGVMMGYGAFILLAKWIRERKYIHILVATLIVITISVGALYAVYPHGQPVIQPPDDSNDLCGGTGGNGQVIDIGKNAFTLKLGNGSNQIIHLSDQAIIETSTGLASLSDLKQGDRVTLIGGPNSDGSFTADTIVLCSS